MAKHPCFPADASTSPWSPPRAEQGGWGGVGRCGLIFGMGMNWKYPPGRWVH